MRVNGFKLILFISFLFLVGCSSSQVESQGNSDTNTGNQTSESSGEAEFLLKSSAQSPQVSSMSEGFDAYLDAIEKKSDGRIQFERYYSGSLVAAPDALNGISSGIADVAIVIPPLVESQIPLSLVGHAPAVFEDSWVGARAFFEMYQEFTELNEELAQRNVKFVGTGTVPSTYIFTKELVESIDDLKGMTLISQGDHGIIVQELGGVPVAIPSTEAFTALQRGTADGALFNLAAATSYKLHEPASNVYKLPIGGVSLFFGMNLDTFNSLPEDLQEIVMEVGEEQAIEFHEIYQEKWGQLALEDIAEEDGIITEAKAEDIEKLNEIVENKVWNKWVEENGPSAQEMLNRYIELTEQFEQEKPYN